MKQLHRQGILLCLVGPSGSGKTSVGARLLEDNNDLVLSVSLSSREPREGEREGKDYHFVSRSEFEEKIKKEELFEWEEIHGNFYGSLQSVLDEATAGKHDLLLDIDIQGALNFKRAFPKNAVIVFLVPPSFIEMERRIRNRASISEDELKRRFATAKREYSVFLENLEGGSERIDFVVVNVEFDQCCEAVQAILNSERCRLDRIKSDELKQLCQLPDD